MMSFAIGEKVVYPNQGVGLIENISTRFFLHKPEKFYLLRLLCSKMTVMVPFANAQAVGLRRLAGCAEMNRALALLSGPEPERSVDWKVRFRVNSEKMLAGTVVQVAEVFRELLSQQKQKPLSMREKKMLERARAMLLSEIAECRSLSPEDSELLLQRCVTRARSMSAAA